MTFNSVNRMVFRGLSVLAAVLCLAACDRISKSVEDRDPNVKRARALRAVGDFPGAIDSYEKALAKRPKSARIHWEMASIYDMELTNDLRAIYHYERFLELDPKAERRDYAEQLIAAAKLQYAISLPDRFSEAVDENARLKKEIDALRNLLTDARDELARAKTPPASASAAAPASAERADPRAGLKPAAPITTTLDSYIVQPGDTLSRIAAKVYNDPSKWDVIFEANKSTLKRPEAVKVGQTLVIPR